MQTLGRLPFAAIVLGWALFASCNSASATDPTAWRQDKKIIDLHIHVGGSKGGLNRAAAVLQRAGIGLAANLSGGTVTRDGNKPSAFEQNKKLADMVHPNRFLQFMNLDYRDWNEPDFSEKAAAQIVEGHRLGAAGLKEYKRLGLYLRDRQGELIKVDDPKLDAVWKKCGELGMPVSIHVADPRAFWLPYDESNERWKELQAHKDWWFGDRAKYPPREELLEALDRVIARHPQTTFICVHFANNAEDLAWVDRKLSERPNMYADLAARIPELGRHEPQRVHDLFVKHSDRILFATDFAVHDRVILGSSGEGENPPDEGAHTFYQKCFRWLETDDRDWEHMTPIQGDWKISSIHLPADVLRKIYFDNARRLLARSLPAPSLRAHRIESDFLPDGKLSEEAWAQTTPVTIDQQSSTGTPQPALGTTVRALWSKDYLYLGYECPFTELTVFSPSQTTERIGLWERDVVEAFIGTDPELTRYTEYQWAPTGEQLDLKLDLPNRDFAWSSGMQSAVAVDETSKVWRVEVRIPMKALSEEAPGSGTRWRINLFRYDTAAKAGLAFSPTLKPSFHVPERFGVLLLE